MTRVAGEPTPLRIGELARRVGVSAEVLRSWQQRYGVLRPSRSDSGYRLYGRDDQRRALRMKELIDAGHAAAEAAAAVAEPALDAGPVPPWTGGRLSEARGSLRDALLALDATAAHASLDHLIDAHTIDVLLRDVVLPVLQELGEGWQYGRVSIAQEHFGSELLAGRLRSLGRSWDDGLGPRVLLACPGGERHDLGLLCCALALHQRGWRITYLGADTHSTRARRRSTGSTPSWSCSRPSRRPRCTGSPTSCRGCQDGRRSRWAAPARRRRPPSAPGRSCCARTP
jgi:DNA-binding transcriptional MerR regulator